MASIDRYDITVKRNVPLGTNVEKDIESIQTISSEKSFQNERIILPLSVSAV